MFLSDIYKTDTLYFVVLETDLRVAKKQIFVLVEKQTLVSFESEHNGVSLECGSRGAVFPEMGNVRKTLVPVKRPLIVRSYI